MAGDRQQLRTTFESAADLYQQARPDYPEQLYETLVQAAGLRVGDRLLEIGCATGKATIPLARRGFGITCLEIGSALAAGARRNFADFPHVEIFESAFETWRRQPDEPLTSSSQRRLGIGSIRRLAINGPGSYFDQEVIWPSGARRM